MTVVGLWALLEGARRRVHVRSLAGKLLAVDLSIWVYEAFFSGAAQRGIRGAPARTVFFRACALLRQGVRLVAVMDGRPPRLKVRQRPPPPQYDNSEAFRESCAAARRVLEALGVPVVSEVQGEADAACGLLCSCGLVDGVISADADLFLFGARLVVKRLSLADKSLAAECVSLEEQRVDGVALGREELTVVALFSGSDYCGQGVPRGGPRTALALLRSPVFREALAAEPTRSVLAALRALHAAAQTVADSLEDLGDEALGELCDEYGLRPIVERGERLAALRAIHAARAEDALSPLARRLRAADAATRKAMTGLVNTYSGAALRRVIAAYTTPAISDAQLLPLVEGAPLSLEWRRPRLQLLKDAMGQTCGWPFELTETRALPLLVHWDLARAAGEAGGAPEVERGAGGYEFKAEAVTRARTRLGYRLFAVRWRRVGARGPETLETEEHEALVNAALRDERARFEAQRRHGKGQTRVTDFFASKRAGADEARGAPEANAGEQADDSDESSAAPSLAGSERSAMIVGGDD